MSSSSSRGFGSQAPAPAGQTAIDPQILFEASHQFANWVKEKAVGAEVVLCGGLALVQYGSPRATQDADLCMDLSATKRAGTNRKFDTNALKGLAAQEPDKFQVGPEILWFHQPSKTPVQVDFVDAALFWPAFKIGPMVDADQPVPALNPPTLLVGKLTTALQRHGSDPKKVLQKQANDASDVDFAMKYCLAHHLLLTELHVNHLGPDKESATATVADFAKLRKKLKEVDMDPNAETWVAD